jgi:UrcA family protein
MTTFNTLSRGMKTTMTSLGASIRLAVLLVLSIGTFAGAANADQAAGDSRTQQVTLAGLNLSTAEGQQLAQARLLTAAHTLCSQVADELDLSHHANFVKCVDSAMQKANQQLQALLSDQSVTRVARADVQ